eukprot:TRINITY_DN102455_c0_g1_i1.p1 TRINITY_DN102455_c0_g1~~TRINITY_DN102455_c0_g1_i1.p1  ORF type:complete len:251 (-),score=41.39 TRINITY_DN102455_c0_g1_i1:180-932(-)
MFGPSALRRPDGGNGAFLELRCSCGTLASICQASCQRELPRRRAREQRLKLMEEAARTLRRPKSSISHRQVEVEKAVANPHEIFFTNPEIMDCFSCGRSVSSTIDDLKSGKLSVDEIPIIRVIRRHGKLATLDHRRLYAFQKALPKDAHIPVRVFVSELPPGMYQGQLEKDDNCPTLLCKWRRSVRVEKTRRIHADSSCPNLGQRKLEQPRKRPCTFPCLPMHGQSNERLNYFKQLGSKPGWQRWYEPGD